MAYQTTANLVPRIIRRLTQVVGTGTQIYAEDRILEILAEVYRQSSRAYWWPDLMQRFDVTVDPTSGIVTSDLINATNTGRVESFGDIRSVFFNDYPRPMSQLPGNISSNSLLTGIPGYISPLTYGEDPTGYRLFKLVPVPSGTVNLHVLARITPVNIFTDVNVLVPIDEFVLINGVCFKYCVEDGNNPAMAEQFRNTFDTELQGEIDTYDSQPIPLDTRVGSIPGSFMDPDLYL
jgi:hypothetical protein